MHEAGQQKGNGAGRQRMQDSQGVRRGKKADDGCQEYRKWREMDGIIGGLHLFGKGNPPVPALPDTPRLREKIPEVRVIDHEGLHLQEGARKKAESEDAGQPIEDKIFEIHGG